MLCAVSVAAAALGWWQYVRLSLRVAFAEEQTEIFNAMRSQALTGGATEAARCLQYVVSYYPPGTKQIEASRLDRIVERSRGSATADILAHLRVTTGSDLGATPEPWIRQYAAQQ